MKKLSRRSFVALSGAAVASAMGIALAGCSGQAPQADSGDADQTGDEEPAEDDFTQQGKGEKLVVGRRGKLVKIAPTVIAENLGYFEEEGCNVEFQQVELAEGFAALATGGLDVMLMGTVQTCEYIAQGTPMYIFGGTVLNGSEILVRDDFTAPLETQEDFRGYNIGYHRPETGQVYFRAWLKDAGLDIDGGDVTFTPMDTEQALVEATIKGDVDICIVNNAFGYANLDRGIRVVGGVKDFTGSHPCCRQNASDQAYNEKYLSLVDFEIALLRGYKVFRTDPDTAIPMMAEYSEQSEDYVRAVLYGTDDYVALMDLSPDPYRNATIAFYNSMKEIGSIPEDAQAPDEFVVTGIYRTALDTLMEREPDDEFWKELDTLYRENDE